MSIRNRKPKYSLEFDPVQHIYRANGVVYPSNTEILRAEGCIEGHGTEADLMRGRYAHRACELYDKQDLDRKTLSPGLVPYLDAWISALRELKIKRFDPRQIERRGVSMKWGFGWTLDRKYRSLIIDIKTGGKQPGYALQTGGYQVGVEEEGGKVTERIGVFLTAEGKFSIEQYMDHTDPQVFCCIVTGYRWKLKHKLGGGHV